MSVLIKGMKMSSCNDCPLAGDFKCNLMPSIPALCKEYDMAVQDGKRLNNCPLIEVPPHGRLIDADAAAKRGWTISRTYSASPTEMVYEAKTMTDEVLPTIIEADVHDNNVGNIPAEEGE